MELDELKDKTRDIKAPMAGASGAEILSDNLLHAIRERDEFECRRVRRALPFQLLASALFLLACVLFFFGIASIPTTLAAHYGSLTIVFMVIAILGVKKVRQMRGLNYSAPVNTFLLQTERRYRFMGPLEIAYSVPLLAIMAITGGLLVINAFVPRLVSEDNRVLLITAYGLFFLAVCAMGFGLTYINWKREKGSILDEIRRMRKTLESQ